MISPNNNFIIEVEHLCKSKNIEYIDAVLFWCEKNNLEVETAAYWIKKDPMMKGKIQMEGEFNKVLKK